MFGLIIVVLLIVKFWRLIFKLLLSAISRLNKKISIRFENNGEVTLFFALVTSRIEGVVNVSFQIPTLGFASFNLSFVRCSVEMFKLKRKSPAPSADVIVSAVKKQQGKLPSWLRWLPKLRIDNIELIISYKDPPRIPTSADRTGGQPWMARFTLARTTVSFELIHSRLMVSIAKIGASCECESTKVDWLAIRDVGLSIQLSDESPPHVEARFNSIDLKLNVEMFYQVLPTIGPLIEIPFVPGDRKQPVPVTALPVSIGLSISSHLSLKVSTEIAGSCLIQLKRISGTVSNRFEMWIQCDGCVMTRSSPLYGDSDLLTLSSFTAKGTGALLDIHVEDALIKTVGDGLVYWIRALIMCGNKISLTKKPYRIPVRNERTKIFYDYELCGIEPKNWSEIPTYIPKIIPIQIRIFFDSHVLFHSGTRLGERIFARNAVLDCNLPKEEVLFSCNDIEFLGKAKRRCAIIRSFNCWAPMFSGMRLKDSQVILDNMNSPNDDVRCHYAAPSELGPMPVCIRFADVTVEHSTDMISVISRMVLMGIEDIRRWEQDPGYSLVPFYKPVTIRLSRLRFAPSELAPVVLDVDDWEMAIGPTKDCLNFAFVGVKAWVPSTVTVPPIIQCRKPAIVKIRVKRLVPLLKPSSLASDYSLQPGSWRDLELNVPRVSCAIAPGLHALTRFIDGMIQTFQRTFTSGKPIVDLTLKRGPIKNVSVLASEGVKLEVVRYHCAGTVRSLSMDDLEARRGLDSEIIARIEIGRFEMEMENFRKKIFLRLNSLALEIPSVAEIDMGTLSIDSSASDSYNIEVSRNRPFRISIKNNAMAVYASFTAIRESVTKAWFIDPLPKLNSIMTHIVDINQTVTAMRSLQPELDVGPVATPGDLQYSVSLESATPMTDEGGGEIFFKTPLVSGTFSFACVGGVEISWTLPHTNRETGGLRIRIPPDQLQGELVFHGFALMGDAVFRRLPELKDPVLVQWLRYPWTVTGEPPHSSSPSAVGREKESWDLHAIMTMRISEYLSSAGEKGRWEYASNRGLIDTPMYAQMLLSMSGIEVFLGGNHRVMGADRLEIRIHSHNLPTTNDVPPPLGDIGSSELKKPKLKMSYWTSLEENPNIPCVDFVPQVHVPLILTLVGSPADADPTSTVIPGFVSSTDSMEKESPMPVSTATSALDRLLAHVDFGFRINIIGVTGRAAGWVFGASRICLFKEEDVGGKGLIVTEIRNAQVAMETALSVSEAVQPLHAAVCLSMPRSNRLPEDVFPLISVHQMIVHVGLPSASQEEPTTLFCNIHKVRGWWSPSLNRGLRLSLGRTEDLVQMVSRWKKRFTNELFARLGKSSRKKKQTFEMIMKIMDWFIPSDGSLKLLLRCEDVQVSFHNLLHGVEDLFSSSKVSTPIPSSADIPSHFLPFRESAVPPPEPQLHRITSPQMSPIVEGSCEFTQLRCHCCRLLREDYDRKDQCLKLPRSVENLNLEVSSSIPSWWLLATHLQGCPLPPVPLMSLFSPPNSRRERAVGATSFYKWVSDCHKGRDVVTSPPETVPNLVKPKPRGSQLLMVATETVVEVEIQRIKGPSNIRALINSSFGTIQGSVAPTALRGLVWLGQSGQTVLRQILQIDRFAVVLSADLFPLRSAQSRLLVPKIQLSTDDDAFQIIADVFRNCILYRGQIIDPNVGGTKKAYASTITPIPSPPQTPPKQSGGSVSQQTGTTSSSAAAHVKREAVVEGLLTALAVADATLGPAKEYLAVEYIFDSIMVNLTHRQRCFVTIELKGVVGKQGFGINHPHRPMQFSFQVQDILMTSADGSAAGDRTVLRSAGGGVQTALLTIRGNDRYITLNNKEWHVYDSLYMSTSPLVIDLTQDLIDEIYTFIFPPSSGNNDVAHPALSGGGSLSLLPTVDEHVEVVGNKLLTGRNKNRVSSSIADNKPPATAVAPRRDQAGAVTEKPPAAASALVFFKFVRFGNIDSIITFKSKQFSLNNMALTVKYYLKRRRLATWKEFFDDWATKIGKQALSSFVKHGFTRKKGIQDMIVNRLSPTSGTDVEKVLFGKYAR